MRKFVVAAAVTLCVSFAAVGRGAEWAEPKDGLVTDKQVTAYLGVLGEWVQHLKAADKALQGGSSPLAAGRVLGAVDERMKASLARHGMTQEEFNWVGQKVWEARSHLMTAEFTEQADREYGERLKKSGDEQAALRQKAAAYEKALKDGRRVLSAEDRRAAVDAARDERAAAEEEAKGYADEAKNAAAEAAKADAEAKAADAAARNPPRSLTGDDRQSFIDEKKQEADSAREAAKTARETEAEARKNLAAAKARAAAAAARAQNPDAPATAEEKAEARRQNEEALARAKQELQNAAEADKLLKETADGMKKATAAAAADPQAAAAARNAAVLKPHVKRFDAIWQGTAGQPK